MTSDAHRLLARLQVAGVALTADDDGLAFDAPAGVMTAALAADVRRHKPALRAILTGRPVPSGTAGVVWSPLGGVRLAEPPDLRVLCLAAAAEAGYPRLPLPHRPAETVTAGDAAWRAFAAHSPPVDLLFAMDALDDRTRTSSGLPDRSDARATPAEQASRPPQTKE